MTDYEKSNKKEKLPKKIKATARKAYKNALQKDNLDQPDLKKIANAICLNFGIKTCHIVYGGVEPHTTNGKTLKSKTHGTYTSFKNHAGAMPQIVVYKYTAKRHKVKATKTTLKTLLHELCHHLDYEYINLSKSLHTAGFYKRISSLEQQLNK